MFWEGKDWGTAERWDLVGKSRIARRGMRKGLLKCFIHLKETPKPTNTQKKASSWASSRDLQSHRWLQEKTHSLLYLEWRETNDEREKSTQSDRKKKATLSMEELCWEKCEQLMRMLLLFVPVLNILDKEGCSLNFFVWPYCVFGCICCWPGVLDGHWLENFSLQRLFSHFIIGEV